MAARKLPEGEKQTVPTDSFKFLVIIMSLLIAPSIIFFVFQIIIIGFVPDSPVTIKSPRPSKQVMSSLCSFRNVWSY